MKNLFPLLRSCGVRRAWIPGGLALVVAGCATAWGPVISRPPSPLQWPFAPAVARVTYSYAWTGLSKAPSVASTLEAVVTGGGRGDEALAFPVAVATGRDGRVAVADSACGCVRLFLPATSALLRLEGKGDDRLRSPVGLAFDHEDRLYVSDSGGALFAFDAAGALRFVQRKAGQVALQRPTGIAWSEARRLLYVVDTLAAAIHAFDGAGNLRFSFGKRGGGEGELNHPTHIARSASGELYVTDTLNFRIAMFDEDGRATGSFGHHGDGSGDLALPKGIAVDRSGVVYVVDALFDNVQLFDRSGRFLMTLGSRGSGFGEFWLPSGAWLGEGGELHICDTYNHRVQVFRVEDGHDAKAS